MSIVQGGLSKLKKKHIRVKHQKVKLFRANEPILSVFMWGVNHTINELSHVTIPVMLLPDDFRAYSKLKVDNHLFNKENMPSHFKIKEYCPLVFRNLRERFGIDDLDYKESMTRSQPVVMDNPGKSGAKFYHSYDRLFVIKTLTSEEVERMHSFLKQYHPYIVERHGKTLLPQYLGMYRLTVDGVEYYMVAMRNVFSNHLATHRKFDLKGSTVDREASDREKEKDLPTFKDNDFVKEGTKIYIGEDAKEKLLETLTADVGFLTKLHLMDYSLLLGIHDCNRAETEGYDMEEIEGEEDEDSEGAGDRGPWSSTPPDSPHQLFRESSLQYEGGIVPELDIYAIPSSENAPVKEIYFLALIDVLTHYGVKKQAAKAAKTVKYGGNVDGISTCDPEQYGPQCKKRWRSIRDHYKKQRKSELSGSAVTKKRASYWDRLNFLEINGDERETFINASQSSSNDYESCDREPSPITVKSENSASSSCGPSSKSQECSQPPNKRSKIQTSDHTFEGLVKERCEDREQLTQNHNFRGVPIQEDENDLFFKSIALSVKKLDPDLAGEVKRKIFEIVTDYEAINRRHSLLGGLGVARIREAPG